MPFSRTRARGSRTLPHRAWGLRKPIGRDASTSVDSRQINGSRVLLACRLTLFTTWKQRARSPADTAPTQMLVCTSSRARVTYSKLARSLAAGRGYYTNVGSDELSRERDLLGNSALAHRLTGNHVRTSPGFPRICVKKTSVLQHTARYPILPSRGQSSAIDYFPKRGWYSCDPMQRKTSLRYPC